jgi:hypothetical protein
MRWFVGIYVVAGFSWVLRWAISERTGNDAAALVHRARSLAAGPRAAAQRPLLERLPDDLYAAEFTTA